MSKEQDRLLTDARIKELLKLNTYNEQLPQGLDSEGFSKDLICELAKTASIVRAETLKEVGAEIIYRFAARADIGEILSYAYELKSGTSKVTASAKAVTNSDRAQKQGRMPEE
jgi:hypothetical protein